MINQMIYIELWININNVNIHYTVYFLHKYLCKNRLYTNFLKKNKNEFGIY